MIDDLSDTLSVIAVALVSFVFAIILFLGLDFVASKAGLKQEEKIVCIDGIAYIRSIEGTNTPHLNRDGKPRRCVEVQS